MSETILEMRDVHTYYGNIHALKGISCTIAKGDIVCLIGANGAGKSTLINRIVGEKVAIVSNRPQTTRNRILGILHHETAQLVFLDTPGVHNASQPLNVRIVDTALSVLADVDLILLVVDASSPDPESESILLKALQNTQTPVMLGLNKIDLVDEVGQQTARSWVADIAPNVRVIEAVYGKVPLELLFDIGGAAELVNAENARGPFGLELHKQQQFVTYTFESLEPLPAQRLHALLRRLPKTVFRAKGLVNLVEKPDHPCVLQSTGRRATLTVGQPWEDRTPMTQIVFIGSHGGVDGNWLEAQLSGP